MEGHERSTRLQTLRNFTPWIAYAAVAGIVDWRAGAAIAFLVAARAVAQSRSVYGDVDDVTITTKWFFAALTVLSIADPNAAVHAYAPALSLAVLGGASLWSLVRHEPFTLTIAKRSVPAELWGLELFHRANVVITEVWAASFLVTATVCASAIALAPDATWLWVSAEVIGFAVPLAFTTLYRDRLRHQFATAA